METKNFLNTKKNRADKLISEYLLISRKEAQDLIKEKKAFILDKNIKQKLIYKPSSIIEENTTLELYYNKQENEKIKAKKLNIEIIYEDEDVIVLNKPSGIITHPARDLRADSLVHFLIGHTNNLSNIGGENRDGYC